jgi:hypothetical protein
MLTQLIWYSGYYFLSRYRFDVCVGKELIAS